MRLVPLFADDSPPEPSPPLSPAREALRQHYRRQGEQLEKLRVMGAPVREAQATEQRLKQAEQALDDIATLERRQLDEWMREPRGALPPPLSEQRAEALAELASATQAHDVAQRRAAGSDPAFRVEEEKLFGLNRETPALIDAVLVEEVNALADRLRAAKLRVAALIGLVKGIEHSALLNKRTAAAVGAVHAWRGGQGTLLDEQAFRQCELDTAEAHRVLALGLLDKLRADPAATVDIDTRAPPTTESAA
ncbi:MAG TPA: hypothetical protein VMU06_07560 [Stellaceae bacterium]|nr:hypothetical protein [Stellaceae bacterium]